MLLAVRLIDLGTPITMGLLWLTLGAGVLVLYRWLVLTGGVKEPGVPQAVRDASAGPVATELPSQAA